MFEKLIRDRIPELAALENKVLSSRLALGDELDRFFGLKLLEESQEVIDAIAHFGHQEPVEFGRDADLARLSPESTPCQDRLTQP